MRRNEDVWRRFLNALPRDDMRDLENEVRRHKARTDHYANNVTAEYEMFLRTRGETVLPMPEKARRGL